jgi:hypothetical protein
MVAIALQKERATFLLDYGYGPQLSIFSRVHYKTRQIPPLMQAKQRLYPTELPSL